MMTTPDKDGWIEWAGGKCPVPAGVKFAVRLKDGSESGMVICDDLRWDHIDNDSDIIAYRLGPDNAYVQSLFAQPEPDRFSHEPPIRAFTNWSVAGNYAIGKGFRPSLRHLTVYLDAMDRLEGWALLQILEAASGSPSFVFRKGPAV